LETKNEIFGKERKTKNFKKFLKKRKEKTKAKKTKKIKKRENEKRNFFVQKVSIRCKYTAQFLGFSQRRGNAKHRALKDAPLCQVLNL
jgi:hypothetical protein